MLIKLPTRFGLSVLLATSLLVSDGSHAYPVDGYPDTGIRRLEGARLTNAGEISGQKLAPGALAPTASIRPRLTGQPPLVLPAEDAALSAQVKGLLGERADDYGIALVDLTTPSSPRYAEHNSDFRHNVGSVGKLVAALGYFQALADAWPDDLARREAILRDTPIVASGFAHSDHHTVSFFDVEARALTRRTIQDGDTGSVWEYLDWTLSVSSNSAAAMVMRDAMLLRQFGQQYPLSPDASEQFFRDTSSRELTALFQRTFWEPLTRQGFSLDQLRQGSFFTREGKRRVNGGGSSHASVNALLRFVLKIEQGILVDEWTSLQLKRLLYLTDRRIRYASSPALRSAAVYFKSGSLYRCSYKDGKRCGSYKGDLQNSMNSVAIIEDDYQGTQLHYVVIVLSNVLGVNSAVEHQRLGTEIHRLMQAYYAQPAAAEPSASP